MEIGFATGLLVVGSLLWLAAMLSGVMRGTVLSISVFSVACGVGFAEFGVVSVDPASGGLRHLAELALILTLFADGLVVERELLLRLWASPARSLIVALPLTMAIVGIAAHLVFPALGWSEALLLGAVLAPTDPVVSASVVSSDNVPSRIRHALNLESGLNDGLALPFVLFFLILSSPHGDAGGEVLKLFGESAAGAAIGGGIGYFAGKVHPRLPLGGLHEAPGNQAKTEIVLASPSERCPPYAGCCCDPNVSRKKFPVDPVTVTSTSVQRSSPAGREGTGDVAGARPGSQVAAA